MDKKRMRIGVLAGLIVMAGTLAACDSSNDETGPYDCVAGAVPSDAQCLEFQDSEQAFRFDVPGLVGRWSSVAHETCIEYAADGTGVFRYWGIVGSVPRDDSSVKWGIWLDVNGDPVLSNNGEPIVVHLLEDGPLLDRRIIGLGYTDGAGLGGGFERVDACPGNVESNQGAITFFSTNTTTEPITIGLDSFVVGELSSHQTGEDPPCGGETTSGILTIYRQPGSYRFQAVSSVATWGPTLIEVKKGECSAHALR